MTAAVERTMMKHIAMVVVAKKMEDIARRQIAAVLHDAVVVAGVVEACPRQPPREPFVVADDSFPPWLSVRRGHFVVVVPVVMVVVAAAYRGVPGVAYHRWYSGIAS